MTIRKKMAGLGLAIGMAFGASSASAAVVDFTGSGTGAADGASLSCSTTGFLNLGGCSVTFNSAGLGVQGGLIDTQGDELDGFGGTESITISFAQNMVWSNITFGLWDSGDDALLQADSGPALSYGGNNPSLDLPNVVSSSLTITAVDSLNGFFSNKRDDFTIASIEVAPVPLPAAGFMLLAGLGGLYAMRRRQKA
ncbi:MAG: VPLPA-CTERM sorting domain-containing protein [Pseudomonadota bacterium]